MQWSMAAIAAGASLGAWLRWFLGLWLNPLLSLFPLGTLAANLLGGLLVGVAFAGFDAFPHLPQQLKLLCITGFLGGLTTFSTFSAEVTGMIFSGHYAQAALLAAVHLLGSLLLTALGIMLVRVCV